MVKNCYCGEITELTEDIKITEIVWQLNLMINGKDSYMSKGYTVKYNPFCAREIDKRWINKSDNEQWSWLIIVRLFENSF